MQKKRAFMRDAAGFIHSAIVWETTTPDAFKIGESYTLGRTLDLRPFGTLLVGTMLTVEDHNHDTGLVSLVFNSQTPALIAWGLHLDLLPFDTEDALEALNTPLAPFAEPPRYSLTG